jgi:hypothetical protein
VPRLLLLACLSVCAFAAAPSAAELARSIRESGLDPKECYRVRDLSFQKEDIRIYLTDGYLIFSNPVSGQRRSAVFTADVEGGDGEVLLLPPYRGERQSLALFTQSANLDEHFRAALMIFTDGSVPALIDRIEKEGVGRKVPEMGAVLAEKWTPVLANVQSGFELRLVEDLLAPSHPGGMLFLALSGQVGNFDMLYDPRSREQIMAGQLAERDGRLTYNVWTSFSSRSVRTGTRKNARDPWFTLSRFRINADLDSELHLKATTRVHVHVTGMPLRVFPFDISRAMHVTAARIDGTPAELFFQESLRGRALRGNDNDVFLVVAPDVLAANSEHEFEFEHDGAVISSAGNGVYYVGARATWYPRAGEDFAIYDLMFRYPNRLTLVTAGDIVEDNSDGDWRTTRWRTPAPIRLAGFNLGDYEKVSGDAPGYTVEVYGNRHLEAALTPRPREVLTTSQLGVTRLPSGHLGQMQQVTPAPPDPLSRLRAVAADVSSALEFFSGAFGPPALKTLTVAPIPGTFGQGFPGLVYLSTISYLDPNERPVALRQPAEQLFFSELMEAHEVAHQWWGNVVTSGAYQDEWLLEALANYSALLWLEKKNGMKAVEGVLEEYRNRLLTKGDDGRTIESAGPIIWGTRLNSTGVRDAWRCITYEKGAWILHMLRRRLGDERFLKMLAELRRRYEFRSISTDDFRLLAREFLPPHTPPAALDGFFDNWVYATGIPALKLQYSVKGVAPAVKLSGTVAQSGVDDDFSIDVPVEVQFVKGAPQTIWVRTANDGASFSATLKQAPLRVILPAGTGVLAAKK